MIIGSSAVSEGNKKNIANPKKYEPKPRADGVVMKGDLPGVRLDVAQMESLFLLHDNVKGWRLDDIVNFAHMFNKDFILGKFEDMLKVDNPYYIFCYSGHRRINGGDLCIEDDKKTMTYISFKDIYARWKNRPHKNSQLLIILDSCFSGELADKARARFENGDHQDLTVIASCRADQKSEDLGYDGGGGRFTVAFRKWLDENNISII